MSRNKNISAGKGGEEEVPSPMSGKQFWLNFTFCSSISHIQQHGEQAQADCNIFLFLSDVIRLPLPKRAMIH